MSENLVNKASYAPLLPLTFPTFSVLYSTSFHNIRKNPLYLVLIQRIDHELDRLAPKPLINRWCT